MVKGMLTWIPPLDSWRRRHTSTGGTDNARYCYSVWLRHLVMLERCGFKIKGACVGELGPGDSIGTGLAALLSGADQYVGLDLLPLSEKANLLEIFEKLVDLFSSREPIPSETEFPRLRPRLESYRFPDYAVDCIGFKEKVERIRGDIKNGIRNSQIIQYKAPWTSIPDIPANSCDLIFSQAVLEYVFPVSEVYRAMSAWLKPGRYASHVIDLSAHYLSPYWNGHWAYSEVEWWLARGRREAFLNREPLNTYIACAREFGFEILVSSREIVSDGLLVEGLARQFQRLDPEDLRTRGAHLVLRKISQ